MLGSALLLGVAICMTPASGSVVEEIKIGAIRWDAWYEGAPDQKVLEQIEWAHRAPFFARYDATGRLHLDGDKEHVLRAEVAYARAIGIDYFIFGFYPDTGSWGRDVSTMLALNRALVTYLQLSDRMGIKFAISINQLFPSNDVADIASSLATFIAHRDYMQTDRGEAPVFVLAHDGLDWSKFFGSDEEARGAIDTMRRATRERTGKEIAFIIMHYDSARAMETARRYGLDMVTTYSNFAPGNGAIEVPYSKCVEHGEAVWEKAASKGIPYAPNITLGWDNRPRKLLSVNPKGLEQGPWCTAPEASALDEHFARAAAFARDQAAPVPFRTITVYSWNEFTEGGWMAPTWGDGGRWSEMLRTAIGRKRPVGPVELTWPDQIEPSECPLRSATNQRAILLAGCTEKPRGGTEWPCPPGTSTKSDMVRAPSGYESLLWAGGWRVKICE